MTEQPENPFISDGEPQWADVVDYLHERAQAAAEGEQRDLLCAIADLIEWHLPCAEENNLVPIATHPMSGVL